MYRSLCKEKVSRRITSNTKAISKLSSLRKMTKRGDISFSQLRNELHVSLERNHDLEKENKKLKEELHLKEQIASLQPQVDEKKSLLQRSRSSIINNSSSHDKQAHSNTDEESLAVDSLISRPKFLDWPTTKATPPRVPQSPPRPKYFPSAPNLSRKETLFSSPLPPPPPPPLPLQPRSMLSSAVHRVPKVVELSLSNKKKWKSKHKNFHPRDSGTNKLP